MIQSVTYLVEAPIVQEGGRLTSPLASARYRAILPAAQLSRSGILVRFHQANAGPALAVPAGPDNVVIVSKSFSQGTRRVAEAAKAQRNHLLVDLCDDHFDRPETGDHLRALCALSDRIVVSTPTLAGRVRQVAGRESVVISDPYEGPAGEARFAPAPDLLRLLWFGHPTNLGSLGPLLQQLGTAMFQRSDSALSRRSVELQIISSGLAAARDQLTQVAQSFGGRLKIIGTEWSEAATWRGLEQADIVVIPSDLSTVQKAAKSPNRMIEGIRAGRLVVAHPVPSYLEFSEFALIGEDLGQQIEAALQADAAQIVQRVKAGQSHIEQHYASAAIGRQWREAIEDRSADPSPMPAPATEPVRLNLGCGDKILPGFVNVDVVESRKGQKPDVLCDLHKLDVFADAHADEVMAIHVVEHFWRWEVVDILREWVRVLKPGGRMILECPNLISACEAVLKNPVAAAGPGKDGQRSMWVLYGDPAWRDPLMCHRWAYTPQSLAQVMAEAGLCNIRQEPAQYKLREPRDMRMVGEKPG